jgi:hypothetical protein
MTPQTNVRSRPAFFVGLSPLTIIIFFPFILLFGFMWILVKFVYFVGLAIVVTVQKRRDAREGITSDNL